MPLPFSVQSCFIVRAMFRAALFLALVFAAAVATACGNTCDRMCDAQADLMERCFVTWETSWAEQSYDHRDDFIARCTSVWGDALDATEEGSSERRALELDCEAQLDASLADTDCQTLLLVEP